LAAAFRDAGCSRLQAPGGEAAILVEINNAFDENASYPMKGSGVGADHDGLPSIVCRAVVDLDKPGIPLSAFHGRGSWTGSDGSLAPPAEGLTTALKIVREVQVTVEQERDLRSCPPPASTEPLAGLALDRRGE
jgi:hypothetical protein